ncbi:MAG TPA: hypothetical protein PK105_03455 [Rectinema sp.]|nr:hypothetical protein [Rectinema sp.]HOU60796.1 hypothetical protein [Rectinema sp.]HQC17249.1 hypothetical protein [Rectinema sp.]HQQ31640.1 hypothetical protein [Rectinema sp.]
MKNRKIKVDLLHQVFVRLDKGERIISILVAARFKKAKSAD